MWIWNFSKRAQGTEHRAVWLKAQSREGEYDKDDISL